MSKEAPKEITTRRESLPLSEITIIDLSAAVAGPMASMWAADFGATVIKVEPLAGDMVRVLPPFKDGVSLYDASANRNKQSIMLDYTTDEGHQVLEKLISTADIVIVNNPSLQSLKKHGLDFDSLVKIKPDLIMIAVSLEGHTGPRAGEKGFDMIAQARIGAMPLTGPQEGDHPYRFPGPFVDVSTAMNVFTASLLALKIRNETTNPHPQFVDVSLRNSAAPILFPQIMEAATFDFNPPREGDGYRYIEPYRVFRAQDGWIVVAIGTQANWQDFCRTIQREDLLSDPRFKTNKERVEHSPELTKILQEVIAKQPIKRLESIFREQNVPAAIVESVQDFVNDVQSKARQLTTTLTNENGVNLTVVNNPLAASNLPMLEKPNFPPRPGEHTQQILSDLGYGQEEIAQLKTNKAVA